MKKRETVTENQLPDDVVASILSYLPMKCLMKCQTVCKSWHEIINSQNLAELNLQNYYFSKNSTDCMLVQVLGTEGTERWKLSMVSADCNGKSDVGCEFVFPDSFSDLFLMIGPVNGLICFYTPFENWICLCNPFLRKIGILPKSPMHFVDKYGVEGIIDHNVGFGYDPFTKDYKVIQLWLCLGKGKPEDRHVHQVEIYQRSTNTWRKLESCENDMPIISGSPVSILSKDGSFIHWLALESNGNTEVVLTFDIHNEVFQSSSLPPTVNKVEYRLNCAKTQLFAKDESLILIVSRFDLQRGLYLDRWISTNHFGNRMDWTRLPSIGPFSQGLELKTLWKNHGLVIVNTLVSSEGKKVVFYDSCGEERNSIDIPHDERWYDIIEYTGSLISAGM